MRLPVVLLWHMHQPQYRDALSGRYVLPWTYLHAIKDYTDMAAHLEAVPEARAVFNFTPVLLEQIAALARAVQDHLREGRALPDPVLALLGPDPVPTDPTQRLTCLQSCLRAQRKQMIERFGPYLELASIADTLGTHERIRYASDQFIHDLAVWYHLAWVGETVRRSDPLISRLTEQGRDFTPAQRRELLTLVGALLANIVPRYRLLSERGQCELSVTPYGHPILPLLFDFQSAREAMPALPLPQLPAYPGGRARAEWHVREGLRVFTETFGSRPLGCWPAEGAVSRATAELLERAGFKWMASSANVLHGSLQRAAAQAPQPPALDAQVFNRPYRLAGSPLIQFFREDTLSDLIGFTYATWHGEDAAHNLVDALAQLARQYAGAPGHVVLIALDGENAWEHYPFNGYYFLRALYSLLAAHPQLELTTLGACVTRALTPITLPQLVAGSWVHGTLTTWMGDPSKNRAWDLLGEAKLAVDAALAGNTLDAAARQAIERQLALCEGSDWFWWFGDYNPADAVSQFDSLFRRQLDRLYALLGREPPASLAHPIASGGGSPEHGGVMRRSYAS